MPHAVPSLSKSAFLAATDCRTRGWFVKNLPSKALDAGARHLVDQGREVEKLAREEFSDGLLIPSSTHDDGVEATRRAMGSSAQDTLFEACFRSGSFVARADILCREDQRWHLIEVKSGTKVKPEYVADASYTMMVARGAGVELSRVSLMLLNPDFVLQNGKERFLLHDVTAKTDARHEDFVPIAEAIQGAVLAEGPPKACLKFACKKCDYFEDDCLGQDLRDSIFDLPGIRRNQFDTLHAAGVTRIVDVPSSLLANEKQKRVREAVISKRVIVDKLLLKSILDEVERPTYYLDFETLNAALPLFAEARPYEQMPTQYSLHILDKPGGDLVHAEYLADADRDCREDLVTALLDDVGESGSVVVYSSFEKTILNALAKRFPQHASAIQSIVDRLFDLRTVFSLAVVHPACNGRESIKYTLPALTDLSYDDLEVQNGQQAVAAFLELAANALPQTTADEKRRALLDYCKRDTLAMVKLHEAVNALL